MSHDHDSHPALVEVRLLHRCFEAWLGEGDDLATDPAGPGGPPRFEASLAPGFRLVHPEGRVIERADLLASLASSARARPGLRLWTAREELLLERDSLVLVSYEEWQHEQGLTRGRHSTALLDLTGARPAWLHVQETWLPAGEAAP